jgi:hypothetical protein
MKCQSFPFFARGPHQQRSQSQVKIQVRTTIPAAGTETTDLSNPGVCYIIRTHESFSRICMTLPVPGI